MTNGLFCFAVVDVVLVGSSLKVVVVVVVKKQAMWCCWCGRWRVALVMQAFTKRCLSVCLACGVYVQLQVTVSYLPAYLLSRSHELILLGRLQTCRHRGLCHKTFVYPHRSHPMNASSFFFSILFLPTYIITYLHSYIHRQTHKQGTLLTRGAGWCREEYVATTN